jgi:UDP-N-acetylmuramyl pentapeptide phosphotransferase/UDP-N-acetylglucosamine-1-phosphate transferase
MSPQIVSVLAVAVFSISAGLTHLFCNPSSAAYVLDHPNERSLHDHAVPRGGGLAILLAILIGGLGAAWFHSAAGLAGIAFGAILVGSVSFLDDHYSIPPPYRLLAHVVAVAVFLYQGYVLESLMIPGTSLDWSFGVAAAFSLLFCVWLINLYNFMDGMDGFASGMAVFGFGCFAVMGWMVGHGLFFVMNLVVASASAGFLVFNFPPARIFMGDVGSSTLGFLAAAFSLWGAQAGIFPFWVAVLVFSPFIADATVTLVRRLLRREKIWQAHKMHYYQRLAQAGWGHRKTVLVEYAVMLGCGITALGVVRAPVGLQVAAFAGWMIFYFLFFFWVSRFTARHDKAKAS